MPSISMRSASTIDVGEFIKPITVMKVTDLPEPDSPTIPRLSP